MIMHFFSVKVDKNSRKIVIEEDYEVSLNCLFTVYRLKFYFAKIYIHVIQNIYVQM